MECLQLTDFNDLYVIAVGVSMAYIVVESKTDKASFFGILTKITTFVRDWLLRHNTKPQQEEEAVIARIDYYLSSGLLREETKGGLKNISKRAAKEVGKIMELERWTDRKLKFHTKTDFLNVISCDCFLYGLFVLLVGAFQNKCGANVDSLIFTMLTALAILLAHCLWFERLELSGWKRIVRPSIPLHCLVLFAALAVGLSRFSIPAYFDSQSLAVASAFACFIGFIAYLLANLLSNAVMSIIILVKILRLGVSVKKAKSHNEEIDDYKDELDGIDRQLGEETITTEFSMAADENHTQQ